MNSPLLSEEKLAILQAADSRRKWHSLDEERVCVLCDRTITGREIEIVRDATGAYSLRCPTPGCASAPTDWFYHGNAASSVPRSAQRTGEMSFWEQ